MLSCKTQTSVRSSSNRSLAFSDTECLVGFLVIGLLNANGMSWLMSSSVWGPTYVSLARHGQKTLKKACGLWAHSSICSHNEINLSRERKVERGRAKGRRVFWGTKGEVLCLTYGEHCILTGWSSLTCLQILWESCMYFLFCILFWLRFAPPLLPLMHYLLCYCFPAVRVLNTQHTSPLKSGQNRV